MFVRVSSDRVPIEILRHFLAVARIIAAWSCQSIEIL